MPARNWKRIGLAAGLTVAVILFFLPAPGPTTPDVGAPTEADQIAPWTLSDWILGDNPEYLLIDVRSQEAFLDDGIKTAMSMPAAGLDEATIRSLPSHRDIVVYADTEAEAVAAWQAIKPYRERAYLLEGGLMAWKETVLDPEEPAPDASEDAWDQYEVRLAAANYYLGKSDAAPVERDRQRVVQPVLRPRTTITNQGC